MLVFTRREGEGFSVGDNIHIKVVASAFGRVKIGIEAPPNVPILRDELVAVEAGGSAAEKVVAKEAR